MQMLSGAIIVLSASIIMAFSENISDQRIGVAMILGLIGLVVLFTGLSADRR